MIELSPDEVVEATGAEVVQQGVADRAVRSIVDSREVKPGDLFFGLEGAQADGGTFAAAALGTGAWGVVVRPEHAAHAAGLAEEGWVLASNDPLRALQKLARAWRRKLGCPVVGITGSTGKTSVKDLAHGLLPMRTHASPQNYNTEVGLPLAILGAPPETEALVLEMAMRGLGQIADLCEIAEPDVGVITNVGPVHLELLGTLEAVAEAKAEILGGLAEEGRAVVPADTDALEPHLSDSVLTITFGPGGDVFALESSSDGRSTQARIGTPDGEATFDFAFGEAHNLLNATCAVAIGVALGVPVAEMAPLAAEVVFSRLRGELVDLEGEIVLVNDCYNASPMSMRAALDHLAVLPAEGKRFAVLGTMAELGPDSAAYHREIGAYARSLGIEPIVGVGEEARAYAPDDWAPDPASALPIAERLLEPGDALLVKGSRSVGLELLADELVARRGAH